MRLDRGPAHRRVDKTLCLFIFSCPPPTTTTTHPPSVNIFIAIASINSGSRVC